MFEAVRAIISKQLRIDESAISEDSNIMEDLGADSLDIVEMLMTIEEEQGISIPDDEIVNLKTVRDIVTYLESNAS